MHIASLDKVSVEIDGENYQLKQVAQIGMPNPQMIVINMASYPEVRSLSLAPITQQTSLAACLHMVVDPD